MKIFRELSLTDFEPWGGACCRYKQLANDELKELETLLNDLFWFEFPAVCAWLSLDYDEEPDEVIR